MDRSAGFASLLIHVARFAGSIARALIPSAHALGYCMAAASRAA